MSARSGAQCWKVLPPNSTNILSKKYSSILITCSLVQHVFTPRPNYVELYTPPTKPDAYGTIVEYNYRVNRICFICFIYQISSEFWRYDQNIACFTRRSLFTIYVRILRLLIHQQLAISFFLFMRELIMLVNF